MEILKTYYKDATIIFTHAAEIRGGHLDAIIDNNTAICDLPFHPNCGLYLDHHMTNRPTPEEEKTFVANGGICHWRDTPSAARAVKVSNVPGKSTCKSGKVSVAIHSSISGSSVIVPT